MTDPAPPDRQAFRALFERHYQGVHRYFEKRAFSADEALDLTQEVFLRAYRGWASFRGEASTATWIYSIAANTFYKEVRRRAADKRSAHEVSLSTPVGDSLEQLAEAIEDEANLDPLDEAMRRERLQKLAREVASLPEQMRTCLDLRLREGSSYKEIAVVLQISPQTVKAHLFQARKRLRMGLEATPDEPITARD